VHLSCAESVEIIAAAKSRGLPITAETCPHYLALGMTLPHTAHDSALSCSRGADTHARSAAEEIPDGATFFKCCPPVRRRANQDALWLGLMRGVLDMVR
jgi:allantoinase